jgi:hypothetical protein
MTRGCFYSSASRNEDREFELPGFGEWPDNSRSSRFPEEGGPRHSIFVGDKDGREENRLAAVEDRYATYDSKESGGTKWRTDIVLEEGSELKSGGFYVQVSY